MKKLLVLLILLMPVFQATCSNTVSKKGEVLTTITNDLEKLGYKFELTIIEIDKNVYKRTCTHYSKNRNEKTDLYLIDLVNDIIKTYTKSYITPNWDIFHGLGIIAKCEVLIDQDTIYFYISDGVLSISDYYYDL